MIATDANQVENLERRLPEQTGDDTTKPRMPFRTDLVLTRDQEDAMVEHFANRMDQIEEQLGGKGNTNAGSGDFQILSDPQSFWGKREKYTARYYNHVEDRPRSLPSPNIYEESNLTASLSQRITRQMVARETRYFFGEPDDNDWFVAEGVGIEDADTAEGIKRYARWKAEQCRIKAGLILATEMKYVRGEVVMKTTHEEIFQVFKRTAEILVAAPKGEPITDFHGDFIVKSDVFVDEIETIVDPANPDPAAAQQRPTGNMVLKRDGVTRLPAKPIWEKRTVTKRNVTFRGPRSEPVYFRDMLIPIDAPGIQSGEADAIGHKYDRTVMQMAQMFRDQFEAGDAGLKGFARAVNILHDLLGDSSDPKAAAGQPRADFKEQDTRGPVNVPRSEYVEVWGSYDADGDGQEEEILLFYHRKLKIPIFYEHAANVTLRGTRPFRVQRAMVVDGRWYGMGAMEYFDPEQETIDLQVNRRNFADGGSGRITVWRPHLTVEGQNNTNLQFRNGMTLTPKDTATKAEDIVSYITLPNDGVDLMELLNLYQQWMMLKSGVINGADQEASDLPTANTATGINEIHESGQELFNLFLVVGYIGLLDTLRDIVDVLFWRMDRTEVFTFFNGGDVDPYTVMQLTPDDVRDLLINVRLTITRTMERRTLEAGAQANALLKEFYGLPFPVQQITVDFYRGQLKALRVQNAEKLIQPMNLAPAPVGADGLPMAMPGGEQLPVAA